MPAEPLLEISGIDGGYGRVQVLWGVELDVYERETVVLLGANGAGKSTLLKAAMGLIPVWSGRILFGGADVTHLRTDRRVRKGMVYMSETAVFAGLTIDENIQIGAQFLPKREIRTRAEELYAVFPALGERRSALASSLSGGQRKMLGIAKAPHPQGRDRLVQNLHMQRTRDPKPNVENVFWRGAQLDKIPLAEALWPILQRKVNDAIQSRTPGPPVMRACMRAYEMMAISQKVSIMLRRRRWRPRP